MDVLNSLWSLLTEVHDYFYKPMGNAFYYFLGFLAVIAALAQWRLYEKCRQPGWAAFVPVLNVIVFLRIVGRPAKHGWLFLVPIWGQFYFMPKVWIEVVQCFGKRSLLDYILVIALNGLYILNLAMSDDSYYQGPVYGKQQAPPPPRKLSSQPSLA
jgi:signal peptidase I